MRASADDEEQVESAGDGSGQQNGEMHSRDEGAIHRK